MDKILIISAVSIGYFVLVYLIFIWEHDKWISI